MQAILQVTCRNGQLVLDEKLSHDLEGKTLKVIILESEQPPDRQKEKFFSLVDRHSFALPEDYKFNREDLYGR